MHENGIVRPKSTPFAFLSISGTSFCGKTTKVEVKLWSFRDPCSFVNLNYKGIPLRPENGPKNAPNFSWKFGRMLQFLPIQIGNTSNLFWGLKELKLVRKKIMWLAETYSTSFYDFSKKHWKSCFHGHFGPQKWGRRLPRKKSKFGIFLKKLPKMMM